MLLREWEKIIWKTLITIKLWLKKDENKAKPQENLWFLLLSQRRLVSFFIRLPSQVWLTGDFNSSLFRGLYKYNARFGKYILWIFVISLSPMEYGICPLRRPSRNSWISRELCLIDVSVYSIYWNYVTPAIDLSSDRSIQRPNLLWFCVRLFIDNYAGKEENLSCDLTAIIAFVLNKSTVNKHRPNTINSSFWCPRVMKRIDMCHVIAGAPPYCILTLSTGQ